MPIFKSKNKEGNRCINLEYLGGIKGYVQEDSVELSINEKDKCLVIKQRVFKRPKAYLNFNQITNYKILDEETIIEHEKSVLGRAAVGGILFGGFGAIVGAISALKGNKTTSKSDSYLFINFIPQKLLNSEYTDDDIEVLLFKITGGTFHLNKFMDELNEKVPIEYNIINNNKEASNENLEVIL